MLPTIDQPIHYTKLPSTGEEVAFRSFLVKEEKILLMAMESKDRKEILNSIKQVIQNCLINCKTSVGSFTEADIGWLFIQLRIHSIGESTKLTYVNSETGVKTTVDINFNDIIVTNTTSKDKIIKVTDDVQLSLKLFNFNDIIESVDTPDPDMSLLIKSIKEIYYNDSVIYLRDEKEEDAIEWIESLPRHVFKEIQQWMEDRPSLYYKTEIDGKEIELRSLSDFLS